MSFFSEHWFKAILVAFIILFISASYMRFLVSHDYMVAYEGVCDEYTENCFIGCEDDECTTEYYYKKVQKYAPTLFVQCGPDITDCENANYCSEGEEKCAVTHCNTEIDSDECEGYTEADILEQSTDELNVEILESDEASNDDSLDNTTI